MILNVDEAPSQFYSPVAFADGHAGVFNFSRARQNDPLYPYEPTDEWMWYSPRGGLYT